MTSYASAFVLHGGCPRADCLAGPPRSPVGTKALAHRRHRVQRLPQPRRRGPVGPSQERGGRSGLPSAGRAQTIGETLDSAELELWAEPVCSSRAGGVRAGRTPAPAAALPPTQLRGAGAPTGQGQNKFCSKSRQRLSISKKYLFTYLFIYLSTKPLISPREGAAAKARPGPAAAGAPSSPRPAAGYAAAPGGAAGAGPRPGGMRHPGSLGGGVPRAPITSSRDTPSTGLGTRGGSPDRPHSGVWRWGDPPPPPRLFERC